MFVTCRFASAMLIATAIMSGRAAAQPATNAADAVAEGPIEGTVTGVEGTAAFRRGGDGQVWTPVTVGAKLIEGDEVRTGIRSAVRFVIPPDQTITLDRLGTIQLIRSNFKDGKFNTDIGMKYGRTRYDIEAAGREHDAKVRSPSSVLAIRGTRVLLYDQPPFTPEAQSLTGRAFFRDVRKQVSVGSRGGSLAKVRQDRDSPADTARADSTITPRGNANARTSNENQLGITLASFSQQPDLQVGVFEIFGQANNQAILNSLSVIGTLSGPQPEFNFSFAGSPLSNVDLFVTTPAGDTITVANDFNNRSPSGGLYVLSNDTDSAGKGGIDIVVFDNPLQLAPNGVYTIRSQLVSGANATGQLIVQTDKLSSNPGVFGPITQTLTSGNPSATVQVNLQGSAVSTQRVQRKKR